MRNAPRMATSNPVRCRRPVLKKGFRGKRLHDHAGDNTVARDGVAVAKLDCRRADQDPLSVQLLRPDAALHHIDERKTWNGGGIDRPVRLETTVADTIVFRQQRRDRGLDRAIDDQRSGIFAHDAVVVGKDVDAAAQASRNSWSGRLARTHIPGSVAGCRLRENWQDNVPGAFDCRSQFSIVVRPGTEIDIERDDGRARLMEALQQLCVVATWPWPAAKLCHAAGVNLDDDHLAGALAVK